MPRRRLYLDTSAYLCILLGEDGWERLSEDTVGVTSNLIIHQAVLIVV